MKIVEIGKIEAKKSYDESGQYIKFDNGEKLEAYHEQDCCEWVYADFENMQVMGVQSKNFVYADELDFFENVLDSVVPIEDLGFYLVTKQGICILVSCYNEQSGYYSSDLTLRYKEEELDISECVKDEIY